MKYLLQCKNVQKMFKSIHNIFILYIFPDSFFWIPCVGLDFSKLLAPKESYISAPFSTSCWNYFLMKWEVNSNTRWRQRGEDLSCDFRLRDTNTHQQSCHTELSFSAVQIQRGAAERTMVWSTIDEEARRVPVHAYNVGIHSNSRMMDLRLIVKDDTIVV